jgi:hypothetical protein
MYMLTVLMYDQWTMEFVRTFTGYPTSRPASLAECFRVAKEFGNHRFLAEIQRTDDETKRYVRCAGNRWYRRPAVESRRTDGEW